MVRLDLSEHRDAHTEIVPCATWTPNYELFTCSDDGSIVKWGVDGGVLSRTPVDSYVTSISWMPSLGATKDVAFAISCTDGTIRIHNGSTGREERKTGANQAHHGAAMKVRWNFDGSALYSAGEDGDMKVWSKSLNLRNTPIKTGRPIYAFAVGPDGEKIVHGCERKLSVVAINDANSFKSKDSKFSWNAHDATVLCVDWNSTTNSLVSGGEDCKYKVWDSFGRPLYQSQPYLHVITAVSWSPNGSFFAVGAFQMLRLCEKTGWSCCRAQPQCGSVFDVCWTTDGTQLVGAGGNGTVVFGQVIERAVEWDNIEAVLKSSRLIEVNDFIGGTTDKLEFNAAGQGTNRVVEMALGYGHLVVSTTTQCYIYSTSNWNTPYIFDAPETVSLVLLSEKHFAVLSSPSGLTLYNYEGRKVSQLRYPGLRAEFLSSLSVSLAPDTVAVVDMLDKKIVRCFEASSGKPLSPSPVVKHKAEVNQIALNQNTAAYFERQLMLIDVGSELFIFQVNPSTSYTSLGQQQPTQVQKSYKLAAQVDTAAWNDKSEMLCAVADGRLSVWAYPQIAWTDKDLLPTTLTVKDATDLGKLSKIVSFRGSNIVVRRADGAFITTNISPYPGMLFDFATNARWYEALKLCRFVEDPPCWATLAGIAVNAGNLDVAEFAFAALMEVDKLEYVRYIKTNVYSTEAKNAEIALFKRRPNEAEQIFLSATPPLLYRAIKMNIRLFRWERALELAVKHRSHVDTVLAYRSKYLDKFNKKESDDRFIQLASTVSWNWDQVKAKKDLEKREEAQRAGVPYKSKSHTWAWGPITTSASPPGDDFEFKSSELDHK